MDINTEVITSLPIWVQFLDLDIKCWGMHSLSKLGSMLGIPLKTDKFTKDRTMLKYARLLIEMPLDGSFPDYIDFSNKKNVLIRQKVHYEWKPLKCTQCMMFGHIAEQCKKKEIQKREWRVKDKETTNGPDRDQAQPITEAGDEFHRAAPRHIIRTPIARNMESTAEEVRSNSFQLLLEEDLVQRVDTERGDLLTSPNGQNH